jgi:hypothetical protein
MMVIKFGAMEFEVTTGKHQGAGVRLTVNQQMKGEKVTVSGFADFDEAKTALKTMLTFIS